MEVQTLSKGIKEDIQKKGQKADDKKESTISNGVQEIEEKLQKTRDQIEQKTGTYKEQKAKLAKDFDQKKKVGEFKFKQASDKANKIENQKSEAINKKYDQMEMKLMKSAFPNLNNDKLRLRIESANDPNRKKPLGPKMQEVKNNLDIINGARKSDLDKVRSEKNKTIGKAKEKYVTKIANQEINANKKLDKSFNKEINPLLKKESKLQATSEKDKAKSAAKVNDTGTNRKGLSTKGVLKGVAGGVLLGAAIASGGGVVAVAAFLVIAIAAAAIGATAYGVGKGVSSLIKSGKENSQIKERSKELQQAREQSINQKQSVDKTKEVVKGNVSPQEKPKADNDKLAKLTSGTSLNVSYASKAISTSGVPTTVNNKQISKENTVG
jgi:hypothetical protein